MYYQQKESVYGGSWGRFFFFMSSRKTQKSSIHTIACDSWQLEWILCFSVPQFAPNGQVERCCLADFGWSYSSSWPIPAAWVQDFERCEAAVKDNPVFGQWGCEDVLAMFWPRSMPQLLHGDHCPFRGGSKGSSSCVQGLLVWHCCYKCSVTGMFGCHTGGVRTTAFCYVFLHLSIWRLREELEMWLVRFEWKNAPTAFGLRCICVEEAPWAWPRISMNFLACLTIGLIIYFSWFSIHWPLFSGSMGRSCEDDWFSCENIIGSFAQKEISKAYVW